MKQNEQFLGTLRVCVDHPKKCWIWPARDYQGYGRAGKKMAHRAVWELLVGPIPPGMELDHLCKVTMCVNPHHLEPVTQYVNNMRSDSPPAVAARQTHCKNGHEFTLENTYFRKDGRGHRQCRRCKADAENRRRARALGT